MFFRWPFRIVIAGLTALSIVLLLLVLAAFVYNRHYLEHEYELVGWPETDEFEPPVEWKPDWPHRVRILAIHGGAMLGLADLELLAELEKRTGKPVYELFDFVSGTSTGTIISTLLLYPDPAAGKPLDSRRISELYEALGGQILSAPLIHRILTVNGLFGPRLTNHARIIASQEAFGDGRFRDLLRPAMFPSFSRREGGLKILHNWHPNQANLYLKPLIAGATSAPTFFPAVKLSGGPAGSDYVSDAGLILNAPGEIAYLHARSNVPEAREFVVVAMGSSQQIDYSSDLLIRGGLLRWIDPILAMVFQGQVSVSQLSLEHHSRFPSDVEIMSYSWSPKIPAGIGPFDVSDTAVQQIREAGRQFIRENGQQIDEALTLLTDPNASLPVRKVPD